MSEKLGIKIEGPAPIQVQPPSHGILPKWAILILILSFIFLITGSIILTIELFIPALSEKIYLILSRWIPSGV